VTPTVSILLPAFNAEPTLPACLRSIQRQSTPNWECVVVDDGSTDGTLACARVAAASDARFVVISMPHGGVVAALNAGLTRCRGRFVARMDADDLMHRHRLALQVAALDAAAHLAAVGCHVRLFPRRALRDGRREYEQWLNGITTAAQVREEAFVECPIAHPTLTIRREALVDTGYRDCDWAEDYDLVLRLLARRHDIGVVPRRLVCWRDSASRLSRCDARYGLDRFAACKAAFLATGFLAGHDTYILWGYGATGRVLHRALLAHGKRLALMVDVDPGRIGNTIHGAPVISFDALPSVTRRPIVVSVAGEKPRRQIREALTEMGFRELTDFVCAA